MEERFKFLVLCLYCAVILTYISSLGSENIIIKKQMTSTFVQPVLRRKCRSVNSVVFIKTHKTGSTTISSILNRYGERHNMSFLANRHDATRGHFRTVLAENKNILPPLGVLNEDFASYKNYNLMTFHIIFLRNYGNLKRLMSPEARYITILRDPVKQWESAFFFFKGYKKMKVPGKNPVQMVNNFLKNPLKYWQKKRKGLVKSQYRNGQWVDMLGNSSSINDNMTHVKELIKKLDAKLHLVLLTDYIDESLVLLKRVLCWEFEDLLYVKMNQRPSDSSAVIGEDQREKIRKWNQADMLLYDHYNQTLWRRIADIGSNFYKDLDVFRKTLEDYGRWCNITMIANKIRKVPVTTNLTDLCQRLVADRVKYLRMMIDRQRNQTISSLDPTEKP